MLPNKADPALASAANNGIKDAAEVLISPLADAEEVSPITPTVELVSASPQAFDLDAAYLISSPYNNPANQLHLKPLDLQSRLFAFALTYLNPIRDDYATAPYLESFNWPTVFETLRLLCAQTGIQWKKQDFYVVIFRSKLQATADRARLGELDQKSHEEACASGSLLHYWFGSTDAERRNLATCMWKFLPACRTSANVWAGVWVTREDAAAGGKGPWHKKARGAAREMYEKISFHTHSLVVEDGAASWDLKDYVS